MAKGRMIDRKIRTSQTFARFTYRQRDLWQGLIEVADDQGRMPGNAAYIRSVVWPYDDITLKDVNNDLDAIEQAGNILRYEVNECEYIQIINWHIYQMDAAWLGKSGYPAPQGWIDHCRYHGKGNQILTSNWETRGQPITLPSHLPGVLPSALPSALPCRDVNGDGDGDINGEGDGRQSQPPSANSNSQTFQTGPEARAERIYQRTTGHPTIPSTNRLDAVNVITRYLEKYGTDDAAVEALAPFWKVWRERKYKAANLNWLIDWAASGEIPEIKPMTNGKPTSQDDGYVNVTQERLKRASNG